MASKKAQINRDFQIPLPQKKKRMSLKKVKIDHSLAKLGYQEYDWEKLVEMDDAESIYERGIRLLEGIGVRRSEQMGRDLLCHAARMGHPLAMAECIDRCYTSQKHERALEILKECLNRGYIAACDLLGRFYIASDCVKIDEKEAVRLYTIASKDGCTGATNRLAGCFYFGIGVESDFNEANKLYRVAAQEGHSESMYHLGLAYRDGRGVKEDPILAAYFFHAAEALGCSPARYSRGKTKLTRHERTLVNAFCAPGSSTPEMEARAVAEILSRDSDDARLVIEWFPRSEEIMEAARHLKTHKRDQSPKRK